VSTLTIARPQARWATVARRIGVVLAAVQAVSGIVMVLSDFGTYWVALVVNVSSLVAAIAVLVGVVPAWRGRRWAVVLCAAGILLMALTGLPVFILPDVPPEAVVAVSAGFVVALVTAALLLARPRRGARD
jgi:hypothetical protein